MKFRPYNITYYNMKIFSSYYSNLTLLRITTVHFFIKTKKKNPPYNITPNTINFSNFTQYYFWQAYKITHYSQKVVTDYSWNLLISFRPYNITHYNMKIFWSYYSNLTILQITTRIFFIKTHRISTLQYYTLHNKIFHFT